MEIIILMLILSALSKLFGGDKGQEKKKQQPPVRPRTQSTPRPTPTPSGGQSQRTRRESTVQTISIEDQQKQQMERLAGQMRTTVDQSLNEYSNDEIKKTSLSEPMKKHKKDVLNKKQANFKKRMKNNLHRDGLANSVIMAEVLGPPKARKPYRSVVADRKR
ncbi:hypothetical protein [Ornithinibacillus halophilus]|uniref:Uncharacterized protein n=1 Tax=Ornithinibacillus halophilus TaxID=930117 RepID=A0A1M5DM87_9BACI|nr:hypothetical protein [Ornithinibacillus halophilus]SHF68138.1 hypothetical protein SAMN05216225_1002129 [Ornithinibacillus halophilus]